MNARILVLTIIALLCSSLAQAQLLEPRPEQNGPEPIATDPFSLINNEQPEAAGEELVLRGQITAFDFVQPETLITLETNEASWQLVAPSAVGLRRLGWSSSSLFVGERVEIQAERAPDNGNGNDNIAQVKRITRANGALLLTGLEQEQEPASGFADVPNGVYSLDPRQAHLFFSFNHLGFSSTPVKVERLSGTVDWNRADPDTSSIEMNLDVSSLRSGVAMLDEALRGPDFFDSMNHPRIRFNSTELSLSKWGGMTIYGELEIMGNSQPVSLQANIIQLGPNPLTQQLTIGVSAKGKINRSDWGMNDYLPMIDDNINITFEGEFILSDPRDNLDRNNGGPRQSQPGYRSSPFTGAPGQPAEFGNPSSVNNSPDVSTRPSQSSGFIFSQ